MTNEHGIIKSESWLRADSDEQSVILNKAIKDFTDINDQIISIQLVEENGLKRFWIYKQRIYM